MSNEGRFPVTIMNWGRHGTECRPTLCTTNPCHVDTYIVDTHVQLPSELSPAVLMAMLRWVWSIPWTYWVVMIWLVALITA